MARMRPSGTAGCKHRVPARAKLTVCTVALNDSHISRLARACRQQQSLVTCNLLLRLLATQLKLTALQACHARSLRRAGLHACPAQSPRHWRRSIKGSGQDGRRIALSLTAGFWQEHNSSTRSQGQHVRMTRWQAHRHGDCRVQASHFASIETRLLTTNLGEDGLGKGSVPTVRVFQAVPVQD